MGSPQDLLTQLLVTQPDLEVGTLDLEEFLAPELGFHPLLMEDHLLHQLLVRDHDLHGLLRQADLLPLHPQHRPAVLQPPGTPIYGLL